MEKILKRLLTAILAIVTVFTTLLSRRYMPQKTTQRQSSQTQPKKMS